MIKEKLPLKIAHISDLHIFNEKRHSEHIHVIDNLKKQLILDKPDIIYLGGDIVDSKSRISPEQLDIVNYFFYSMTDISPVICIIGNHDANLYVKEKLDALTPIINELKPVNPIYLLRNSGVYNLFNIDWIVWSRLDDKNPLEDYKFGENYTIGCYHGPVEGSITDSGWNKFSKTKKIGDFGDCDTIMLGDIHKLQFFKSKSATNYFNCAYPGSTHQITVDESEIKGYLLWQLDSSLNAFIPEFKQIENDYSVKTIHIKDIATTKFKPSQVLRLVVPSDITAADTISLQNNISNNIIFKREKKDSIVINDIKSEEKNKTVLSEKEYFYKYFKNLGLDDDVIKQLEVLDDKYNLAINNKSYNSNEYFLKELEIKNFLCFKGVNNVNFEEINGLVGLFGENGIGKSSLMLSIMFCLFNKTLKDSNKFIKLVNDQLNEAEEVYVMLKLIISGALWEIKRSLVINSKFTSATPKLEVYEYVNGKKVPRHKEDRIATDRDVLSLLVGNENIFSTTVLSSQNQQVEFTDKENAERLELTNQFLGLDANALKHKLSNQELLKLKVENENLEKNILNLEQPNSIEEKKENSEEIIKLQGEIINNERKYIDLKNKEKDVLQNQLSKIPLITFEKTYEEMLLCEEDENNKIKIIETTIKTLEEENEEKKLDLIKNGEELITANSQSILILKEWKKFSKLDHYSWNAEKIDNKDIIASFNLQITSIKEDINKVSKEYDLVKKELDEIENYLIEEKKQKGKILKLWKEEKDYLDWNPVLINYNDLIESYEEQIVIKKDLLEKEICPTCGHKQTDIKKIENEILTLQLSIKSKQIEEKKYNEKIEELKKIKKQLLDKDKIIDSYNNKKENKKSLFEQIEKNNNKKEEKLQKITDCENKIVNLTKQQTESNSNNNKGLEIIKKIKDNAYCISNFETIANNLNLFIERNNNKIQKHKNEIETHIFEIKKINNDKEKYLDNKEKIKERSEIEVELSKLISLVQEKENNLTPIIKIIEKEKINIEIFNDQLKKYEDKLIELRNHSDKLNLYSYYVNSMSKKGISLLILKDFIPFINDELNNTLTDLFDFSIEFEISDKNTLEISFCYDNLPKKSKRDINQACGKESTIVNLIIRAALAKISKLPKPSLLLLDEKFAMLDKNNLLKLPKLLEKLKEQYNVIIMITHDDNIKEWPDNYIILKNNLGVTTIV